MPFDPNVPNGPIPGENYTSDTRNYPWHRPPDLTDLDSMVEFSIKKLTEKDNAYALLTMLQAGVPVVTATDMFVTSGIAQGKWTPDYALLLAGPVSHMIKMMADGYGVKYDMGLDDQKPPTIEFLKAQAMIDPRKVMTVVTDVANQADMFKANADNQAGQQQAPVGLLGAPDTSLQKPGGMMGMPSPSQPPQGGPAGMNPNAAVPPPIPNGNMPNMANQPIPQGGNQ